MSKIHPNRYTNFPIKSKEVWVFGYKSRRDKTYLFYRSKGKIYTANDFEIYVRSICEKYNYKKFEFLDRNDMYKSLQNSRYKMYKDFPFEYFKTTWKQINPEVVELEEKEELFSD